MVPSGPLVADFVAKVAKLALKLKFETIESVRRFF
jgi:hypothetical protein